MDSPEAIRVTKSNSNDAYIRSGEEKFQNIFLNKVELSFLEQEMGGMYCTVYCTTVSETHS
jgi:hypothetical protein